MHSLRYFPCLQRGIDVAYESIGGEVFETCLNRYWEYFSCFSLFTFVSVAVSF